MSKYIGKPTLEGSTRSLYNDIDDCITSLLRARASKNTEAEGKALFKMESLMVGTLQQLSCVLDSLQQAQADVELEKEMEGYFKGWTETDEGIACHYQYVDLNTCRGIARNFYELGLNARKED